MSKIIRIGTRDSALALWQAKTVQAQLEHLGHKTTLVPIKSTGDLVLDKPLYELGITGIFTKTLDVALLKGTIDIAVHSLKDVPTKLPIGITQAAVLKRGNVNDSLVFKRNEEFLSSKDAVIATGSLRRRAQWLNRYPHHTVEDLRGNVNSRLQKLEDNEHWNAAIFAAAGLGRLNIKPEHIINLSWMVPAPAQGAVMVAALEGDANLLEICKEINHKETEICTTVEREFLRRLEGGCTAPIGALAFVKNDELNFKGILLSNDGSKKIEVSKVAALDNYKDVAEFCADYVISKGGKTLIDSFRQRSEKPTIFSTKKLTDEQQNRFHKDAVVASEDFIQISLNRIPKSHIKVPIEHVVITSKNAVEALLHNFPAAELQFKNIYCVGRRTKRLIEKRIGKVAHTEANAESLAQYLVNHIKDEPVTYFCSNQRLDTLPKILQQGGVPLNEIEAYQTKHSTHNVDDQVDGILFFSPSTVESYLKANAPHGVAFCIGETTAEAAAPHFKEVKTAKVPLVDNVIELVNDFYKTKHD